MNLEKSFNFFLFPVCLTGIPLADTYLLYETRILKWTKSVKRRRLFSQHVFNLGTHCRRGLLCLWVQERTGQIMQEKSTENNEVQRFPSGSGSPRAVNCWDLGEPGERWSPCAFPVPWHLPTLLLLSTIRYPSHTLSYIGLVLIQCRSGFLPTKFVETLWWKSVLWTCLHALWENGTVHAMFQYWAKLLRSLHCCCVHLIFSITKL